MLQQLEKAQFLMDSDRHEQALEIYHRLRASEPESDFIHAQTAVCLHALDRNDESMEAINTAIGISPEESWYHYFRALLLAGEDRYKAAMASLDKAIELDAEESPYFTLQSNILASMKQWEPARQAALTALQINPEDTHAQVALGYALQQLGEREGATEAMKKALEQNPDNDANMASQGLILLHQKQYQEAKVFFREALRINPHCEPARYGMLTVLKARNPFFRLLLQFNLWLSKFDSRLVTAGIIGAYFLIRFLRNTAEKNPGIKPFITPLLTTYLVIVAYMWFADPISNFFLRLSKDGKYLLNDLERRGATWVGIWIGASILAVVLGFVLENSDFFYSAAAFACLILPFHQAHDDLNDHRKRYLIYAYFMMGLATLAFVLFLTFEGLGWLPLAVYFISLILFQWVIVLGQAKTA